MSSTTRTASRLTAGGVALALAGFVGVLSAAPASAATVHYIESSVPVSSGALSDRVINETDGTVYFLNRSNDLVVVVAADGTATEVATGSTTALQNITIDQASGDVWVAGSRAGSLVYRIAPDLTVTPVSIGATNGVQDLVFNPTSNRVELALATGGFDTPELFAEILPDLSVVEQAPYGSSPNTRIAVDESTGYTLIASQDGAVTVWDGATMIPSSLPISGSPKEAKWNAVTQKTYVLTWAALYIISPDLTMQVVDVGTYSEALSILSDERVVVSKYLSTGVGEPGYTTVALDGSVTFEAVTLPYGATLDANGSYYQSAENTLVVRNADGSSETLTIPGANTLEPIYNPITNRVLVASIGSTVNIIAAGETPEITTLTLPDAQTGAPYDQLIEATGDATITFAVTAGALPAGLVLDPATGAVTGTPTTDGVSTFTVEATNTLGAAAVEYTITVTTVTTGPVITTPSLVSGALGASYSALVEATGTPAASFGVSAGSLPPGLELDATTGAITGTPTEAGSFVFTVTATNSVGTDAREFSIDITAPTVITPGEDLDIVTGSTNGPLVTTGANVGTAVVGIIALFAAGAAALAFAAWKRRRADIG